MEQTIADYQITGPVAKKISISIDELILNSHARITVSFFDENGSCVDNKFLTMTGTDYDAWGTDDEYVKTWALAQLGLTAA
tara:strand:- start:172 stop:414 length:243 start_codon:yes stop_codon:yes gene_type:complete